MASGAEKVAGLFSGVQESCAWVEVLTSLGSSKATRGALR